MSLVDKSAIQALTVNQVFDDIQRNKRCYARMAYMKNYFRKGNPTQVVLANWIDLMDLGEFFGPLNRLHRQTYWIQYNSIDLTTLTTEQKQVIKDYYEQIFPFFVPGAVVPPIPPAHPLRPPVRPTVLFVAENLPSNDLVDKAAIRALNINQLFEEIQQNKVCFARISFIKNYFVTTHTKEVLSDWITFMDEGEYLGQEGLRRWGGLELYPEQYRNIDTSRLTPAQKQVIKDYYLRVLPFLANPAVRNPFLANLPVGNLGNNINEIHNHVNNNNLRTIANNNVRNNNNAGNNNNNNRSVLSSYPRGGKRKQKGKTRKSKKTRKH